MSHLKCNHCGSTEHFGGYGIGFGFYGAYVHCECGKMIWRQTDCDDLPEDQADARAAKDEAFNALHSTPTGADT